MINHFDSFGFFCILNVLKHFYCQLKKKTFGSWVSNFNDSTDKIYVGLKFFFFPFAFILTGITIRS